MIQVVDIEKTLGDKQVLKKISTTFETGKNSLIIGQSGSGKTVLMKCMVGLLKPDMGYVLYDGRNFTEMSTKEQKNIRQEIGMVFQGGALFDSMNVEQNVMFPLDRFTSMSKEEKLERVNFCLKRVNLENVNRMFPSELSGGMQKRVAIARAISVNPQYLFCDEPTSGLDPKTAQVIDSLIDEISKEYNITTVINTHDMNSVLQIGDSINYISEGVNCWQGDKHNIMQTDHVDLRSFLSASELTRRLLHK